MAEVYVTDTTRFFPPEEACPKSKAMARIALQMDDGLAEAHLALAYSLYRCDWDWAGAETEFQRATALNPNYALAHRWYGGFLHALGRRQNWIAEVKRADELDPVSLLSGCRGYPQSGQYDLCIEIHRKKLELYPNSPVAYGGLGDEYRRKAMYPEAIANLQKAVDLSGGEPGNLSDLGYTYAVFDKRNEALKILHQLTLLSKRRYVSPYTFAFVYVGLGEKDRAFDWLQKGVDDHSINLVALRDAKELDSIRSDPRFAELLRRIGLPP
jgi:tetratricopeptide (TPR) repeat protein